VGDGGGNGGGGRGGDAARPRRACEPDSATAIGAPSGPAHMDRRRALAYARVGVAYPVGSVVAVAGGAALLGADPGLAVLALSMVSAATLAGLLVSETGGMRPPEAARGREQQRGILGLGGGAAGGGGGADGDLPDVARSRRARLRVFSLGLFVLTVTLVLVLGGVVPGL